MNFGNLNEYRERIKTAEAYGGNIEALQNALSNMEKNMPNPQWHCRVPKGGGYDTIIHASPLKDLPQRELFAQQFIDFLKAEIEYYKQEIAKL